MPLNSTRVYECASVRQCGAVHSNKYAIINTQTHSKEEKKSSIEREWQLGEFVRSLGSARNREFPEEVDSNAEISLFTGIWNICLLSHMR